MYRCRNVSPSVATCGATLVIPPASARDNIRRLLAFCNRERITEISGFPYLLLEFNKIGRLPDGRRMYRSGDLGYRLPDGTFGFLHRKDTQVMILGKRVECEEVENVLSNCSGVMQALVCAFTDGNSLSYLVAYIVEDPHVKFSLEEVKKEMAVHLASFMIPDFFVKMPSLPMTPNGKPDRSRLPVVLK